MRQKVRDIMTSPPVVLRHDQCVADAARVMRDQAVGCVLVMQDGKLAGLLTDRDIVVRAIADTGDPGTTLGQVCSRDLVSVSPGADAKQAVRLMRDRAIRRLPVVDHGRVVGIVSLVDLALEVDRRSALADISGAEPNT